MTKKNEENENEDNSEKIETLIKEEEIIKSAGRENLSIVVIEKYSFDAKGIPVEITIIQKKTDYVPHYIIKIPLLAEGTKIMLNALKGELITEVKIDVSELLDLKAAEDVRKKFSEKANELLDKHFTGVDPTKKSVLVSYLLQSTLGLGELEILMADDNLEDVTINGPNDPVWIYHKRIGWCKTNLWIRRNEVIYDYASMIGRKVGRQINVLNPVMNAHLSTGDRVNATISPISTFGNTISIRRFSRNPWTIPTLIDIKTINPTAASLLWLSVQNEISILSSGGTGSGKTSFLNALCCMIPPNQRVISIEDTRELNLPEFLQWVALTTREPNPEGKGEVTMLNLLVNSLRMRPDRIIVGEVRRQREAEVLFEAIHTGHSVYATIHADTSSECITRLTTPPINLPKAVIPALGGIVIQYRNRRSGIRRTFEFSEITETGDANILYRWDPKADDLKEVGPIARLGDTIGLYTGMTSKEINEDIKEKEKILRWMTKKKYFDINIVGKIISDYYKDPKYIIEAATKNKEWI